MRNPALPLCSAVAALGLVVAGCGSSKSHAAVKDGGANDLAHVSQGDMTPTGSTDMAHATGTGPGGVPGASIGPGTTLSGCQIFPNDNAWNVAIDGAAVEVIHNYDSGIPQGTALHPDFGNFSTDGYGIPINVVAANAAENPMEFTLYAGESDPGPGGWLPAGTNPNTNDDAMGSTKWPFYMGMKIEGNPMPGGTPGDLDNDQHGIVLQQGAAGGGCTTWEAWQCLDATSNSLMCANGAKFDLTSNALRPLGWTSADLGGLSILAGLVRLSEVKAGVVTHAIRVTFDKTQSGYIAPASHATVAGSKSSAGALGSKYPPLGLRLRLKASVDISKYAQPAQVVLTAMKKYGLIVADIGTDWYFQGDSDDGWDTNAPDGKDSYVGEIHSAMSNITGADFEVVYSGDPIDTNL